MASLSQFTVGTLGLSFVPIHMHCVQVETLCCPSLDWGGHSLLQIFLMTQSLNASVSSLMYVRLIGKSVSDAELYFFLSAQLYLILLAGTAS